VVKNTRCNEAAYTAFAREQSCIVIVSNATARSDRELVLAYKGRWWWRILLGCSRRRRGFSYLFEISGAVGVLVMLLVFSLLVRVLIEFLLREGLGFFGCKILWVVRVGLSGWALFEPTFKLLFGHGFNCFCVCEGWVVIVFVGRMLMWWCGWGAFGFAWL